jgi:hydrogenase maturation protein HypF
MTSVQIPMTYPTPLRFGNSHDQPSNLQPAGEASTSQFIRRARGYAPFPVRLPFQVGQILAVGAELKNTFCLTRDDFAFLSQHIGDMENLETLEHFETTVALYQHLFRIEPRTLAYDLHPDYLSTQYATRNTRRIIPNSPQDTARISIQHHHAHIAACLADNGWLPEDGPVIGVAWDGTGYGLDGHIWGGEFFVGDYRGFRRTAHLEYLPMPGGDAAIYHPWRLALGYVYALTGLPPLLPGLGDQELRIVRQQVDRHLNTPLTSAAGRLFDAVAALVGTPSGQHRFGSGTPQVTYEAQAAIELEMLATQWAAASRPQDGSPAYPFDVEQGDQAAVIRLRRLLQAIQADVIGGMSRAEIGWRFHLAMAELIAAMCQRIAAETGLRAVALSGGCFQNRLLLALTVPRLEQSGFCVLLHRQVPCNDGGLSLGQAVLAHFASAEHEIH